MSDVVVTVPKGLWLDWIDEGDAADVDTPPTGEEWGFFMGGPVPAMQRGDRVYVVAHNRLRGYAPLTRIAYTDRGYALCREAGAVAVTIHETIPGFRGWRHPWWHRSVEVPFPDWRTRDVTGTTVFQRGQLARMQRWEREHIAHAHTEAQLLALTPPETRADFAELAASLAKEEPPR